MIAAGAIARDQGGHQPISETALGVFVRLGHRRDDFAAGKRIALAAVVPPRFRAPVAAGGRRVGGVVVRGTAGHVHDAQLPQAGLVVSREQFGQHALRRFAGGQQDQGPLTPHGMIAPVARERNIGNSSIPVSLLEDQALPTSKTRARAVPVSPLCRFSIPRIATRINPWRRTADLLNWLRACRTARSCGQLELRSSVISHRRSPAYHADRANEPCV